MEENGQINFSPPIPFSRNNLTRDFINSDFAIPANVSHLVNIWVMNFLIVQVVNKLSMILLIF